MYLSRVQIDTKNRRKMKDLSHLGAYHGWVESSFSNDDRSQEERSRKLWRIDTLKETDYLIVLSEDKPNETDLEKYAVKGSFQCNDYGGFLNQLEENHLYRFRLTANPTISVSVPGQRGRVFPHITVEQQKTYLISRSLKHGFEIENENFDIVSRDFRVLKHKNSKSTSLSCVTYEGVLKIVDVEVFIDTLINGLGKKKAYGFGLMTVIPI